MALNASKFESRKALNFRIEKFALTEVRAQVGFAMDVSGSQHPLYLNGVMQNVNDRIYPVAERFDDNQSMDICLFDGKAHEVPDMTRDNYENYINDYIMNRRGIWGTTAYAPAIKHFVDVWFGSNVVYTEVERPNTGGFFSKLLKGDTIKEKVEVESRKHLPSYLIFQTDGENSDEYETERLIQSIQDKEIYITFMGIGDENFTFIRRMADRYPNVGFFHVKDLEHISDDELYAGLITEELSTWLKNAIVEID